MIRWLKDALYFTIARYFRFLAGIRLAAWHPRIVVVTGSNGKTTALHLIEAQLGRAARYSHRANSTYGISFDILDLARITFSPLEWITLALKAPFRAWKKPPLEKIYVVEADCDRPGEGSFLASFLKPEITVWLNLARTHSMNFEKAVHRGAFETVDDAIAHEFGYFAEHTSKLLIVNGDDPHIMRESKRTRAHIRTIRESDRLERYAVGLAPLGTSHLTERAGTEFTIDGATYHLPYLLPKETFRAIAASLDIARYFGIQSSSVSRFALPPGRSSIFKGIRNTTIIDSTYNANVSSATAILTMVAALPHKNKLLILGDLIEQGAQEQEEHEKIGRMLAEAPFAGMFQKIILVGPRLARYTLPLLKHSGNAGAVLSFDKPKEALDYIKNSLEGGELLTFKGARFLEGVIERLLANRDDAQKLCRREPIWQKRRAQWGL